MQGAHLTPQHVPHLAKCGGGAQHDAGVVAVQVPEDGDRSRKIFPQPVAGFHRHPTGTRHRPQHVALLLPQLDAQHFAGENYRVRADLTFSNVGPNLVPVLIAVGLVRQQH